MRLCVFLVLLALPAFLVEAQTFGEVEDRQTNVPSYYFHVLPGEGTMQVFVWGTVRAPGLYVVSDETGLDELLSLAGGPQLREIRNNDRREVAIRLYHPEGGARTIAYEALLDEMIANPGEYPPLRDGDVIEVTVHDIQGFGWRDLFSIAGAVAAVALAVERIISLSSGN